MQAAEFNKQMYDDNTKAYSLSGAQSIFEELNSARTILDQVRGKQTAAAQAAKPVADAQPAQPAQGFLPPPPRQATTPTSAPAPAANAGGTANTYVVKIDLGGRPADINVNSANDAKALIDVLLQAKRAAGM